MSRVKRDAYCRNCHSRLPLKPVKVDQRSVKGKRFAHYRCRCGTLSRRALERRVPG